MCANIGDSFGVGLVTEGGKTALVKLYGKSDLERHDWLNALQHMRGEIDAKRNEHFGASSPHKNRI